MRALLHSQTRIHVEAMLAAQSGSYIFHGPPSLGKATVAAQVAQKLNCRGDQAGLCGPCRQFEAHNYPDFVVVQPEDRPSIGIEQIRVLIQALSLSPYYQSGRRVVLIDEAQSMTVEAQNALLKLIEEPPPQTLLILVTHRFAALLPTVRSRCAAIFFAGPPDADIAQLLTEGHGIPGPQAATVAAAAAGAPGLAITLATRPDEAKNILDLTQLAATVPELGLFDRLLLCARLSAAKSDLAKFGQALHVQLVRRLRDGRVEADKTTAGLEALERFRRQLQAKVAPRVALERLMLEL